MSQITNFLKISSAQKFSKFLLDFMAPNSQLISQRNYIRQRLNIVFYHQQVDYLEADVARYTLLVGIRAVGPMCGFCSASVTTAFM